MSDTTTTEIQAAPQPVAPRARRQWGVFAAIRSLFAWAFAFVFAAGLLIGGLVVAFLWNLGRDVPDHAKLQDYHPPEMSRVYAGDGRLLAELAYERRVFVPFDQVPPRVIDAFLSAEDKTFWTHPGVSLPDIARAAFTNIANYGSRRPIGASTITQQVAKNLLLSNEVSIERKVKEIVLAMRIEEALPKQRILELYLNEIFFGYQAYGVAAAAQRYFGKTLDELTLSETAYLAALPKAPNNYHPFRFPQNAKARRDWVLGRMVDDGKITAAEADAARATPIRARLPRENPEAVRADYFAEEVRRELIQRFGEDATYKNGMTVRSSLDPDLQRVVDGAIRRGMVAYDRRHGWRGAMARIEPDLTWREQLAAMPRIPGLAPWLPAAVLGVEADRLEIGLADGSRGLITLEELRWARRTLDDQKLGPAIRHPRDVATPGDVIAVELVAPDVNPKRYTLRQLPNVGAAVVAMDIQTGRVLAISGGWSYEQSQFNRATQAQRQPGSSFKPFVYLAALDKGYTPASIILDAPFALDQGGDQGFWTPSNYSRGQFYGPTPLRVGVELSRNLMTVRLANSIGMDTIVETARDFGIHDNMPPFLSSALGAIETTVLKLTTAYAMIGNGGRQIAPTFIDRVEDREGRVIHRSDARICEECTAMPAADRLPNPAERRQLRDPGTVFQMISILEGVIERGTGTRAKGLNRPLAGKTGTTNDSNDTWFIGFSGDLAVGVWFGFDTPRTLGPNETGGLAAVPVFREVMAEALKDRPVVPFVQPSGLVNLRIDPKTGLPSTEPGDKAVNDWFKQGTEPKADPSRRVPTQSVPLPSAGRDNSGIY
jgi:penicillin-binding protein 1A